VKCVWCRGTKALFSVDGSQKYPEGDIKRIRFLYKVNWTSLSLKYLRPILQSL